MELIYPAKKHILICLNKREGKCCGNYISEEEFKELKKEIRKVNPSTWLTKTGCLGYCHEGTVILKYPEKKIYLNKKVKLKDLTCGE